MQKRDIRLRCTTFTSCLPRAYPDGPIAKVDGAELTIGGDALRVLVAEDNASGDEFAPDALMEQGYDGVLAFSASSLWPSWGRIAASSRFPDVVMPGMSNLEFDARIGQDQPTIPITFNTGLSSILAHNSEHGL